MRPTITPANIEEIIGYAFDDKSLLQSAINYTPPHSMQRLAFLGKEIIKQIFAEIYFDKYHNSGEGELTARSANIIQDESLALMAKAMDLGDALILNSYDNANNKRNDSGYLSKSLSALIGAIYQDAKTNGSDYAIATCKNVIAQFRHYNEKHEFPLPNYKSELVKWAASNRVPADAIKYEAIKKTSWNAIFEWTIRLTITGSDYPPIEIAANSKKAAEVKAAKLFLEARGVTFPAVNPSSPSGGGDGGRFQDRLLREAPYEKGMW